jgi:tRNA threonylcarbamoyladenosine modification (KEOPS) complex Cgi121 subunit
LSWMVHSAGIKGSGWYVAIGGFKGGDWEDVEYLLAMAGDEARGTIFQFFDAERVAGWRHLYFAAVNAVLASEKGTSISRSLAIEVLLYASCQDQISRAFEVIGLSQKTKRIALLVLAQDLEEALRAFERISSVLGEEDDSALMMNVGKFREIMETFGVSDLELEAVGGLREEALTRLVVERGALLPLRR